MGFYSRGCSMVCRLQSSKRGSSGKVTCWQGQWTGKEEETLWYASVWGFVRPHDELLMGWRLSRDRMFQIELKMSANAIDWGHRYWRKDESIQLWNWMSSFHLVLRKHERESFWLFSSSYGRGKWKGQSALVTCKRRKTGLEIHTWVAENTFYPSFLTMFSDWNIGIHLETKR